MKMIGSPTGRGEEDKGDGETGDKALIVFVDRGIDIYHESFFDASRNTTRFVGIWDRGADTEADRSWRRSDDNTYGVNIGRVFTRQEINEEISSVTTKKNLRCSQGNSYHATAVASIAAGSPVSDGDLELTGIAPKADILFVSLGNKEIRGESKYIDILDFIYRFSEGEKKPAVVNFSFGWTFGTHDGTSLLELKCEDVSKKGLIIVTSAGNERKTKSHIERMLPMAANSCMEWQVSDEFPNESKCSVLLAFSQFSSMRFRLLKPLRAGEGEETRESSDWIYEGTAEENWLNRRMKGNYNFSTGDTVQYTYDDNNSSNPGCHTLTITIDSGKNRSIQAGIWKLEIEFKEFSNSEMEESEKKIHAWLDCDPWNNRRRGIEFRNVGIEDEKTTLTIPGTAKHVIAVGSIDSNTMKIDPISSLGPTRDERKQPVIAAIGTNIIIALAGDYSRHRCSELFTMGGGTSYAAPRVAGAIALCLSAREKRLREGQTLNRITAADIKDWIVQADSQSGWADDLGYGILVDGEMLLTEEARTYCQLSELR
jgi:subtilisin family serine protease